MTGKRNTPFAEAADITGLYEGTGFVPDTEIDGSRLVSDFAGAHLVSIFRQVRLPDLQHNELHVQALHPMLQLPDRREHRHRTDDRDKRVMSCCLCCAISVCCVCET